jgi:prephenate dehydratase
MAVREAFPEADPLPCQTFEDAFQAVTDGVASHAVIPIENTLAGRVPDIHHLLPDTPLRIVGEHFLRVRHQLLALPGAEVGQLKTAHSHPMALGQCRTLIRELGLTAVKEADTAGAARLIAERGDRTQAAIASRLAGEVYGLEVLRADVEDATHNTTRFVILALTGDAPPARQPGVQYVTAFLFRVRNVPAALYKALGGFATNGVNMTKLESYQVDGSFNATQFYAEVEGHVFDHAVQLALEELGFFAARLTMLGVFPAAAQRTAS